jgi:sigma-B regulation protein RsbQ
VAVGQYLGRKFPNCMLRIIENVGHCPHLSAPSASVAAMEEFLATL